MERVIPKFSPSICESSAFVTAYVANGSDEAYKHVFTSPSSVDQEPKATRSGNARIHGMTSVTPASIAYVATQVRNVCIGNATEY
jgi:hypothetical protein